jgi:polyisoprenoid-binding protein YceI
VLDASCQIFTFKEGLLSRIAHDLEIRVEKLSVTIDEDAARVEASFDARTLRVVRALDGGREKTGALSADDRAKIEKTIQREVLETSRHPEIRFRSTRVTRDGDRATVEGELTLHGVTRRITLAARVDGDAWTTEVELHQPDFGITPYTAALGTLRVKPSVRVRLHVPR